MVEVTRKLIGKHRFFQQQQAEAQQNEYTRPKKGRLQYTWRTGRKNLRGQTTKENRSWMIFPQTVM